MAQRKSIKDFPVFMREGLLENGWTGDNNWSGRETLDAWLKWEGIIGWTDRIIKAVEATQARSS